MAVKSRARWRSFTVIFVCNILLTPWWLLSPISVFEDLVYIHISTFNLLCVIVLLFTASSEIYFINTFYC
jgi:hypothetical protein